MNMSLMEAIFLGCGKTKRNGNDVGGITMTLGKQIVTYYNHILFSISTIWDNKMYQNNYLFL